MKSRKKDVRATAEIYPAESSGSEPRRELSSRHIEPVARTTNRVISVPLILPSEDEWRLLRRLAFQSAAFGNVLLSEQYAKAKGFDGKFTTYTDFNDVLSSAIRDAVGREVVAIWRREGRKVLRGEQTLGRFSADRALTVRGVGVRCVEWGGGNLAFHLRMQPKPALPMTLRVDMHAIRHWKGKVLRELLEKIYSKEYPLTKASIIFRRPGRKVALHISYTKPLVDRIEEKSQTYCIIRVLSDGTCRLQEENNGKTLTLTDRVYRLIFMKTHFERIHARIKASLGKAGRRRENRIALLKAGNFETWAQGPIHQLSRQIVDWCVAANAGKVVWQIDPGAPSLPWHELQKQVAYKAEEKGISVGNEAKAA